MEGSGKMVVTAVGIYSQTGIILSLLGAAQDDAKDTQPRKTFLSVCLSVCHCQCTLITFITHHTSPTVRVHCKQCQEAVNWVDAWSPVYIGLHG